MSDAWSAFVCEHYPRSQKENENVFWGFVERCPIDSMHLASLLNQGGSGYDDVFVFWHFPRAQR